MFNLRDALAVGSIHLSNEFFCLSQGVVQMKQQLEDELRNYCVLVEPSKTPFGKSTAPCSRRIPIVEPGGPTETDKRIPLFRMSTCLAAKKTYTGKMGGRNDDIAIVTQLAIAGVRCFYTSDKYRTFRPIA